MKASRYGALFQHLASWGFVVVGNEEKESWDGVSTARSLNFILNKTEDPNSVFYHKIDPQRIGISGHSQGGAGVFNAITAFDNSSMYRAAVALSPTNEEQAISLKWNYDLSKIQCPILLFAGTEGIFETQFVIPIEKMDAMFAKIPSERIMARKLGMEHGEMLYASDGYVTAWFLWKLCDDETAASAFLPGGELWHNPLYCDQYSDG